MEIPWQMDDILRTFFQKNLGVLELPIYNSPTEDKSLPVERVKTMYPLPYLPVSHSFDSLHQAQKTLHHFRIFLLIS